jgi:hypothetical protein
MATNGTTLNVPTLETWLWEAACQIRGPLDAPPIATRLRMLLNLKGLGLGDSRCASGVEAVGKSQNVIFSRQIVLRFQWSNFS